MDNCIFSYWQGIENGTICAGKWVRLLYEKIVDGIEGGEYIFNQQKADNAIRYIERYCHHNKGALAPGRVELSLWQKAAISTMFGIVDDDGNRHFRECFMMVGRKCGKTLLASGIISYMAFVDGEHGAEIYCIAPKLDQADLVYSAFKYSTDQEDSLRKKIKPRKTDLYIKDTNTTIKKIAFSEKRADGYNPHLVIADEISSWPGERGLKQWEVMVSGTGARTQPLILAISSAGYENDGIFDELYTRGTRFLTGESAEGRLLPILYQIDDPARWDDINELQKSLPGLGVSIPRKFMLEQIDIAHGSLSKRVEFMTKYAGIKQNASTAWLTAQAVKASFPGNRFTLEDFRDCYCLGGIDLSQTTDLTACCILIEKGGVLYYFTRFFLPREKVEEATARDGIPYRQYITQGFVKESGDNFVDYEDCARWFKDLVENYQILPLKIGYDRYSAQYLVKDMEAYGFHMESVFQGTNLTGVINTTEGMLKDGALQCADDNNLMKIHWMDAAMKLDAETNRRKLVKVRRNAHVDGVACMLDAMCMRQNYWEQLQSQLRNEG